MQAKHATVLELGAIGNSAAGKSGPWLVALFVAFAAALVSQVPSMRFDGAPVVDAPQLMGTLPDASLLTGWSAFADLSVPRASDVRFAPAGDEEVPATF